MVETDGVLPAPVPGGQQVLGKLECGAWSGGDFQFTGPIRRGWDVKKKKFSSS